MSLYFSISKLLSFVRRRRRTVIKTMSTAINPKLLIIKSDFALFKQNKSDTQGTLKAIHISEVDRNHDVKKTTISYPLQHSAQSALKKDQLKDIDSLSLTWDCIAHEQANNLLREYVEDASIIIVSDKVTRNLIENFVENPNVQFIIHP